MRGWTSAAALVWLACFGPATAARAGVSIATGLTADHDVEPGAVVHGEIVVVNDGAVSWTGTAYLTDYATARPDQILFPDARSLDRSNAAWVVLDPPTLHLGPGERGTVRYTIEVPADDTLSGAYWSMVMLEPVSFQTDTEAEGRVAGVSVRQRTRIGVRLTTSVAGGLASLKYVGAEVVEAGGGRAALLDVQNEGTTRNIVSARVELVDAVGARLGPFVAPPRTLYPGCSWQFRVPFDVPAGTYAAVAIADGGPDAVVGTRLQVSVP